MLWILISLFFWWMLFREIRSHLVGRPGYDGPDPTPISKTYVAVLLALALLFAWPPFHYWRMEHFLSAKATELADLHRAKVHCNTVFDTFFDSQYLASGHASPVTGQIVFQYPWCATLMNYLDHPDRANDDELASLNMLTHESMHVRGEYNEAKTECEAVQRDYRAAKLLGVPDSVARKNALDYYRNIYMRKGKIGGIQAAYFTVECAPGRALDEHLPDSTWASE
jgi:hypothetical protein